MVTIIQTTSSMLGYEEMDFQSRTFKYKSFSELIDDFECHLDIWLGARFSSTMYGTLRPSNTMIEKCLIKSSNHAMYSLKRNDGMNLLVRFYKI